MTQLFFSQYLSDTDILVIKQYFYKIKLVKKLNAIEDTHIKIYLKKLTMTNLNNTKMLSIILSSYQLNVLNIFYK